MGLMAVTQSRARDAFGAGTVSLRRGEGSGSNDMAGSAFWKLVYIMYTPTIEQISSKPFERFRHDYRGWQDRKESPTFTEN